MNFKIPSQKGNRKLAPPEEDVVSIETIVRIWARFAEADTRTSFSEEDFFGRKISAFRIPPGEGDYTHSKIWDVIVVPTLQNLIEEKPIFKQLNLKRFKVILWSLLIFFF